MTNKLLLIDNVDAFVFDFDGVLTNNLVYINQEGEELVSCSRSDGLAFDVLRKLRKPAYILSTEKNLVVSARAEKINVPVLQGTKDKAKELIILTNEKGVDIARTLYVGNDLNDFECMKSVGFPIAVADAFEEIKKVSDYTLTRNGGEGAVREFCNLIYQSYNNAG